MKLGVQVIDTAQVLTETIERGPSQHEEIASQNRLTGAVSLVLSLI
jgi:hypothetical protein